VLVGSSDNDLLSSSLAQAQIDLDPYQFIEDKGTQPSVVHKTLSAESGKIYCPWQTEWKVICLEDKGTQPNVVYPVLSDGIKSCFPFEHVCYSDQFLKI